jgi:molybdate-binding protein
MLETLASELETELAKVLPSAEQPLRVHASHGFAIEKLIDTLGMADVGMGVETPSRRFNLDFVPLASERYFLLCDKDSLHSERLRVALDILASSEFRAAVDELPGYSGEQCGVVQSLQEAFPQLKR